MHQSFQKTRALIGTVSATWIGAVKRSLPPPDLDPDVEGLIRAKHVWTFTGEGPTGTFEGVVHSKWIGFPPPVRSYSYYQMVLQGTGDLEDKH